MVDKMNLATLVANESKKKMGRVKDEAKLLHHDICCKLQSLSESSGFPMGVLVYIAVGTSAHKPSVFAEGYKAFNEKRAKKVISMCTYFAKHMGNDKIKSNDKLVHAVCRYDDLFDDKGKVAFFKACVDELPKDNQIKMSVLFPTAKELGKYIFKDSVAYNDKGYFIPFE